MTVGEPQCRLSVLSHTTQVRRSNGAPNRASKVKVTHAAVDPIRRSAKLIASGAVSLEALANLRARPTPSIGRSAHQLDKSASLSSLSQRCNANNKWVLSRSDGLLDDAHAFKDWSLLDQLWICGSSRVHVGYQHPWPSLHGRRYGSGELIADRYDPANQCHLYLRGRRASRRCEASVAIDAVCTGYNA